MAFKSVPKSNFDAGKDLIDQIPPTVVGAVIAVIIIAFFGGMIYFLRSPKPKSAPSSE